MSKSDGGGSLANALVQLQIFEFSDLPETCRERARDGAILIQVWLKNGRIAALRAGKMLSEMRQELWASDARMFESWLEVCVGIDPATAANLIALYNRLGHVEGLADLPITDAALKKLATAEDRIIDLALSVAESGKTVNLRTLKAWREYPDQQSLILAIGDTIDLPTIRGTVINGDRASGTVTVATDDDIRRIPISDLMEISTPAIRAESRPIPQQSSYSESILRARLTELELLLERAMSYTRYVLPLTAGVYRSTGEELLEDLEEWVSVGVSIEAL